MTKIAVIDSDLLCCQKLDVLLKKNGYESQFFTNGKEGLEYLKNGCADIIFWDAQISEIEEEEIVQRVSVICPNAEVIITTAYPNVKSAVQAIKKGASDYLGKPFLPDEILALLNLCKEKKANGASLREEFKQNKINISEKLNAVEINTTDRLYKEYVVGKSKEARNIQKQIDLVASTNYSVIIYGESGTGKESIAYNIHMASPRRNNPFIAIDCGALTKELAGSELFGHEKGAFTGALHTKIGQFELADKGTVFLDEITNLPYDIQVSLLRFIQERKIKRLGSSREIHVDIRILVASNKKIHDAVHKDGFREDLYHRFNEFSIDLPPLRKRAQDVMTFAEFFLKNCNAELGKQIQGFSEEVKNIFLTYTWPGNLREMNNVIKRATLLCDESVITPVFLGREMLFQHAISPLENKEFSNERTEQPMSDLKTAALRAEYERIVEVLRKVNYNKSTAAALLNIDRKTIYNKMRAFQITEQ
jgi:two-component system response regulator HydG